MDHEDSAGAFAAVQGIKAGRFDRFLDQIAAEIRVRQSLIDDSKPPKRTLDMVQNGQLWAWIDRRDGQWEALGDFMSVLCDGFPFTQLREELIEHWHDGYTSVQLARWIAQMRWRWHDGRDPVPVGAGELAKSMMARAVS